MPPIALAVPLLVLLPLADLDSESFRRRDQASARLWQHIDLSYPYLQIVEKSDRATSEAQSRAKALTMKYRAMHARAWASTTRPKAWPRMPWIDMTPRDFPDRTDVVWSCLDEARLTLPSGSAPHWPDYRLATEILVERLYRDGWTKERIVDLLDEMGRIEGEWIDVHGRNYDPPLVRPDKPAPPPKPDA